MRAWKRAGKPYGSYDCPHCYKTVEVTKPLNEGEEIAGFMHCPYCRQSAHVVRTRHKVKCTTNSARARGRQ